MAPTALTGAGNVTTVEAASASSLDGAKPGNTITGDLLWAVVYYRNSGASLTPPAGWTLVKSDATNATFGLYVKPITNAGTEPATYTFSASGAGSSRCILLIGRITGADLTNPVDAVGAISVYTGTSSLVHPQATAATTGTLLLAVSTYNTSSLGTAPTVTADPAMTQVAQEAVDNGSAYSGLQVAQQPLAAAGATGTRTATMSPSASNSAGFLATIKAGNADLAVTDSATVTETPAIQADTSDSDAGTGIDTAEQAQVGEPSFTFAIDWDADGDFTTPGDDVTERILARGQFRVEYGRDQSRALSPSAPGRGGFELDNDSRDYSPENPGSPLAGKILPARPFQALVDMDGDTRSMMRAHLDEYDVSPDPRERSVKITLRDALADLGEAKIFTGLHRGITTGRAVDLILDAAGWPLEARDIDRGSGTIAWWWENDTNALEALKKVVASEGPGALIHADPDGRIVFRGRHHRLTRPASVNVQATFRDGAASGPEPWFSRPLTYDVGWRDIINSVSFAVDERQADGDITQVWTSEAVHTLADGETLTITAQPTTPFLDAVVPVAGTDYTLLAGVVTVLLSRTSGQSTDIIIRASGGPARLSGLALRARALQTVRTVQIHAADNPSIAAYGERSWPDDAPWATVPDAAAIATLILAYRAERLPIITMRLIGTRGNTARLVQQATRDLSDRIHIVETETATDSDYFIEQIKHTVSSGPAWITDFGCEKAPAQVADVFILGSASNGVLGTNRLGRRGIDDPAMVFVLGSATNGVLGANILAT